MAVLWEKKIAPLASKCHDISLLSSKEKLHFFSSLKAKNSLLFQPFGNSQPLVFIQSGEKEVQSGKNITNKLPPLGFSKHLHIHKVGPLCFGLLLPQ